MIQLGMFGDPGSLPKKKSRNTGYKRRKNKKREQKRRQSAEYRRLDNARRRTRPSYKAGRERARFKKKGITKESYLRLLEMQGEGCAICKTTTPGGNGRFHIDHDHTCCPRMRSCGTCVRGLLCHGCNLMLGFARDNPDILRRAIAYLSPLRVAMEKRA